MTILCFVRTSGRIEAGASCEVAPAAPLSRTAGSVFDALSDFSFC